MRKSFSLIALILLTICIAGCSNDRQSEYAEEERVRKEAIRTCLIEEIENYLTEDSSKLVEIPQEDITSITEGISFYKAAYLDDNTEYAMFEFESVHTSETTDDFVSYFYNKYPVYQSFFAGDVYIYIHSENNDLNLDKLNNCFTENSNVNLEDGKKIKDSKLEDLEETTKVVIEGVGTIENPEAIDEFLDIVSSSRDHGGIYLADGPAYEFEMYDKNDKLIDIIYVWGDTYRIAPTGESGYYIVNGKNNSIKKLIEEETDYVFYSLYSISDECDSAEELFYEDDKYEYYFDCHKSGNVLIRFDLTGKMMGLKYALENNYLNPALLEDWMVIKKEKN